MPPTPAMAGCMMKYRCSTNIWTAIQITSPRPAR